MDYNSLPPANDDRDFLEFLRTEGLELLALYRRIEDPKIRAAIIDFLKMISREENR